MAFVLTFLLYIASTPFSAIHDFHVSVCEIVPGPDDGQIDVSLRLFLDDLELALKTHYDLENLSDQDTEPLIEAYIKATFSMRFNEDKTSSFELVEIVGGSPAIVLVLRYENVDLDTLEDITVEWSSFVEIYDDQLNMVNLYIGKKSNSMALDGSKTMSKIKVRR